MSRRERQREEARERWPALASFFGGYLHEDWPIFSGTPDKAVDEAIADHPVERRRQIRRELLDLLERTEDTSLRSILNDGLGVNVHFKKPAEARAFVEEAERKLLDSIKRHFDVRQTREQGK